MATKTKSPFCPSPSYSLPRSHGPTSHPGLAHGVVTFPSGDGLRRGVGLKSAFLICGSSGSSPSAGGVRSRGTELDQTASASAAARKAGEIAAARSGRARPTGGPPPSNRSSSRRVPAPSSTPSVPPPPRLLAFLDSSSLGLGAGDDGGGERGAAVARRHQSLAAFPRPVRRCSRPPTAARAPRHRQACACRFVREDDRKRALVSRLLQYSLVHHLLRIPFQQINICRTIEGKPYLKNNCSAFPSFNFSTSHQGGYVGIASEPLCLVGLDIVSVSEPHGETATEFVSNFSSYLTDHEWNCIVGAGTPRDVLTEFYRYWCLKEAFVKAIGAGVGFGLHRLEFHHENWTNISICIDGEVSKKWRFWLFELDETHLASIAKGHPEDAINNFKKTLSNVIIAEKQLSSALDSPEEAFTLRTMEELTQAQG